jgi:hypothetical protein
MIEQFTQYFWVWETEINAISPLEYVEEILCRLPLDSRYKHWTPQVLAAIGGRLWLMRKDDRERIFADTEISRRHCREVAVSVAQHRNPIRVIASNGGAQVPHATDRYLRHRRWLSPYPPRPTPL